MARLGHVFGTLLTLYGNHKANNKQKFTPSITLSAGFVQNIKLDCNYGTNALHTTGLLLYRCTDSSKMP